MFTQFEFVQELWKFNVFCFLYGYKQQVAQFNFENRCTAIMPLVEAGSAVTSTEATLESAVTSTEAMESVVTSTASAGRPTNATIQAQPLCINWSLVSAIPGWQTCCKLCFQSNGQYHSERCKAALPRPREGEPVPISHVLVDQLAASRCTTSAVAPRRDVTSTCQGLLPHTVRGASVNKISSLDRPTRTGYG